MSPHFTTETKAELATLGKIVGVNILIGITVGAITGIARPYLPVENSAMATFSAITLLCGMLLVDYHIITKDRGAT